MHHRLVFIGASAAGVFAAASARSHGYEGELVVLGDEPHQPYERPPLSKALHPGGELRVPILAEDYYRTHGIELRLGAPVVGLSPESQTVELGDGTRLNADAALIATGARPRRLDCPGADFAHVGHLRSLDDAERIRVWLDEGGPLVIVGGGLIGLELAAVAVSRGIEVTVVEQRSEVLLNSLGAWPGSIFRQIHLDAGVDVITGHDVRAIRGTHDVEAVELSAGRVIPAAAVVVGIGVHPNTDLVDHLGLVGADGIEVNEFGQTPHPWIHAAGDVAQQPIAASGERARIEHWNSAMSLGSTAGAAMAGVLEPHTEVPYFWSDQYDFTLQVFGRTHPDARVVLRGNIEAHSFSLLWVHDRTVVAAAAVNSPADARGGRLLVRRQTRVEADELEHAPDLRRVGSQS